jgi:hypothetical protein
MFGNVRQQIIRRNVPGATMGGFGGGTFDMSGHRLPEPQQAPQSAPKRNTSQRIAGYIADALAGLAGREGPYAQQLAYEQRVRDQESTYQRRRADEYADWQKQQEWERANPKPSSNDTVADFNFISQNLGAEAAQEFLRNKANPPAYRVGPDGQFYRVDVATAPSAPVGRLTPIEEGAGSNAGGGFPAR